MLASKLTPVNGISPLDAIEAIVRQVSIERYSGNVELRDISAPGPTRVRFTLRTRFSDGPGARRAASGRRTIGTDWEAHREIMARMFELWPDMHLHTALIDYRGKRDFELKFPLTYHKNVGSLARPAKFGTL